MKKLLLLSLTVFVALVLMVSASLAQNNVSYTEALIADSGANIGTMSVSIQGNTMNVNFAVTDAGWCLESSAVLVDDISVASHANLNCVTSDFYSLPRPKNANSVRGIVSASNAPANQSTLDIRFGETATLTNYGRGTDVYFLAGLEGAGFSGIYGTWCVALDHFLSGQEYIVEVLEPGTPAANSIVPPDKVNPLLWITHNAGNLQAQGANVDTIQAAIWILVQNVPQADLPASMNIDFVRAQQLANQAMIEGQTFTPTCGSGGYSGAILNPITSYPNDNGEAQELFVPLAIACSPTHVESASALISLTRSVEPTVTFCHVPPGNETNPQIITIPESGISGHLGVHEHDFVIYNDADRTRCLDFINGVNTNNGKGKGN